MQRPDREQDWPISQNSGHRLCVVRAARKERICWRTCVHWTRGAHPKLSCNFRGYGEKVICRFNQFVHVALRRNSLRVTEPLWIRRREQVVNEKGDPEVLNRC